MTATLPTDPLRVRLPAGPDADGGDDLALQLARPAAADPAASDLCVLYLHGFGSSQDGDKAQFFRRRLVAAGLTVASIDFRGHGTSGGSLFDLSLSRNLEDIARAHAFVREQGFRRLMLFGSSMGAASALWYAARHEDEGIVAAVHVAPAVDLRDRLAALVGREGLERWQRDGRIMLPHASTPAEIAWSLMDDLERFPPKALAGHYKVPTLIFQGKLDTSVAWRSVLDFVDACDAAIELHLMTEGDHRLIEHKDHLWRVARSYLIALGLLSARDSQRWT